MKKYTAYQIINSGTSICPNVNRDEYYKEEFVKLEEIEQLVEECLDDAEQIHSSNTHEDFGQLVNSSGELEVLDVISKIKELKDAISREDGQ